MKDERYHNKPGLKRPTIGRCYEREDDAEIGE